VRGYTPMYYSGDEQSDWAEGDVSEAQLKTYRELQQKATGVIQTFTTPTSTPNYGGGGGGGRNGRNRGQAAPPDVTGGVVITISTDDHYAQQFTNYVHRQFRGYEESDSDEGYSSLSEDSGDDMLPQPQKRRRSDGDGSPPRRKRRKEYHHANSDECVLCGWGNKLHDGIEAEHFVHLNNIINMNYGTHHNKEIAIELSLYFKEEIYDPTSGMKLLTKEMALEHIESLHTLNARIYHGEAIKEEKEMKFLFKNIIWKSDGTFNQAAVNEYRKSKKMIHELMKTKPSELAYAENTSVDDMKRMAAHYKMMPKFDQKKVKRRPLLAAPANSTHRGYF
jgi:hypothetical protein